MTHPVHQAKTNRFLLGLDASSSMLNWDPHKRREYIEGSNAEKLIKVVDAEITRLAELARKGERDPETGLLQEYRVSILQFSSRGQYQMLIWEMDPRSLVDSGISVGDLYKPHGNTAMCEAVNRGLADMALIPETYGDNAGVFYVFSDGQENDSEPHDRREMTRKLGSLPKNWTVACFVPDEGDCVQYAVNAGFPKGNVQPWDTRSEDGVFEVGRIIAQATDTWLKNRAQGIRSTPSLFSTGAEAVNKATVQAARLTALPTSAYVMIPVTQAAKIRPWVEQHTDPANPSRLMTYTTGHAYYELTKTEEIQPTKAVAIVHRHTGEVLVGAEARRILGLPDMHVRVKPEHNPDYKIFVQSKSVNRNLVPNTQLLYMR
jgi:hypothetical protein